MSNFSYKKKYNFEDRKKQVDGIVKRYPNRIPVIIEKEEGCKSIDNIDRNKFLVPDGFSMSELILVIRNKITLSSEKALFVFINNQIMNNSRTIREIYNEYKDHDGFLYVKYAGENTFG
jgi:GABA(A) receptor-associated protein